MWERLVVISVYIALAHGSVAGHIEPGTCVCVTGSHVNARHTGTVFLTHQCYDVVVYLLFEFLYGCWKRGLFWKYK